MCCPFQEEVCLQADLALLAGLQHRESMMEDVSTTVLPTMAAAATTPPVVRPVMTTQVRLAQLAELPSVTQVGTAGGRAALSSGKDQGGGAVFSSGGG